jgi:putative ABC transport system permease protein
MRWMRKIFWRRHLFENLAGEIREHLNEKTDELVAGGMSRRDAEAAARREFGNVTLTERDGRGVWRWSRIEDFLSDARYGLRGLRRNPGFTAVAILTLAVGIGANASIFTMINGLIIRPLPYPEAERLMQIDRQTKDGPYYGMTLFQFRLYQRQNQSFESLAACDMLGSGLNLNNGTQPELIQSRRVSADFFRVLGVPPSMGRDFNADDDRPGAPRVVILSHRVWTNLLGGNPAAIGRSVRMGGENYLVIGITPENFLFSRETEAWIPLRMREDPNNHASAFRVIGRLRTEATRDSARQDLNAAGQRIRKDYPGAIDPSEIGTLVTSYQVRVVGDVRRVLLLLSGAVACVLLIACSNIASLLLARAVHRRKEIAIRTALGIGQARLVRQLLTESTLLSFAGAAAGLLLSQWCIRLFLAVSPDTTPHMPGVVIDSHVLLFTVTLAILTGLLFGAAPAWQLGRLNSAEVLRESGRATTSTSTRRMQGLLVSLQISLATILLLGAGLLLSSFVRLLRVDPGFEPRQVLTLKTSLVGPSFSSSARVDAVTRRVVTRLQALPGVQAAAAGTLLPTQASLQVSVELPSLPAANRPAEDSETQWRAISSAYFEALRIPLLQGRSFSEWDAAGAAPVAVVNQAFCREYFSHRNGIGQQVLVGRREGPQFADRAREIVGIIADTRETGLDEAPAPAVFIPLAQVPDGFMVFLNALLPMNWLVRVSGEPLAFARMVHEEMLGVDPDLVTSNPQSLEQVLSFSLAQQKMQTALLALFSAAALLLGALGLYGVLAYSVAERRQEFGIRAALGASSANVGWMVLRESSKLAIWGLAAGLVVSLLLGGLLKDFLFGITPANPGVYVSVVLTLTVVVFAASYLPARRAMKIDPIVALRND